MKLKTDTEIKALAKQSAGEPLPDNDLIAQWKCYIGGYEKGYTQAQQDLLASASEGFEEYIEKFQSLMLVQPEVANYYNSITLDAWQAAKLSSAKEIEELEKRNNNQSETMKFLSSIINVKDAEIEKLRKESARVIEVITNIHKRLRDNESELRILADLEKLIESKGEAK